jgi:transcriptional regulator NrdR family protein
MKCPHCSKEAASKVLESRQIDGAVWRLRSCRACFKPFVSRETTDLSLRMPYGSIMRRRDENAPPAPPPQQQGAPRGDGAHLQGLWG